MFSHNIRRLLLYIVWLLWSAMLLYLMLYPADGTLVADVSGFFGGLDVTDAFGHVILFAGETLLTFFVFRTQVSALKAKWSTVIIMLLLAFLLETLQIWIPGRGASLLDYAANGTGVGVFLMAYRWADQQIAYIESHIEQ
jgi:hypothetical protein